MIRAFIKTCACMLSLSLSMLLAFAHLSVRQARGTEAIRTIEFAPGKSSVILTGAVQLPHGEGDMHNDGADRYTLSYRAGQTISFDLVSEGQRAVFSVSKDNHDALKIPVGTKWSGRLSESGNYIVNVFTNVGSANYTLKVSLRRGAGRKR